MGKSEEAPPASGGFSMPYRPSPLSRSPPQPSPRPGPRPPTSVACCPPSLPRPRPPPPPPPAAVSASAACCPDRTQTRGRSARGEGEGLKGCPLRQVRVDTCVLIDTCSSLHHACDLVFSPRRITQADLCACAPPPPTAYLDIVGAKGRAPSPSQADPHAAAAACAEGGARHDARQAFRWH